jgi:RNA-binding protein YlmH
VDVQVKTPSVITLRGYGKYNLLDFDGETKRGRLRLVAQKYV